MCSGHWAGIHHIQTSSRFTPNRSLVLNLRGESELTLWLQLLDDGQSTYHSHRSDGLHALLCHLTHRLQVRILSLCTDISRGEEIICGAHQGQVGHPSHHALQSRKGGGKRLKTHGEGKESRKSYSKIHTGCGSTATDTIFLPGESRNLRKRNLFQDSRMRLSQIHSPTLANVNFK